MLFRAPVNKREELVERELPLGSSLADDVKVDAAEHFHGCVNHELAERSETVGTKSCLMELQVDQVMLAGTIGGPRERLWPELVGFAEEDFVEERAECRNIPVDVWIPSAE